MSLHDLNWGKGFLRLWVLASSIWVIVLGCAGIYPAADRYGDSLKATQELKHGRNEAILDLSKTLTEPEIHWDWTAPGADINPSDHSDELKKTVYAIRDPRSGKKFLFCWILSTPPNHANMRQIFSVDTAPEKLNFIAVNKITGNKLTLNDREDQKEYVQSGEWYEVNRRAKSTESSKQKLLFYSGMTFLPPVSALLLGIWFMWVLSGFVSKQSR
jgi:hypothetical protein